MDEIVEKYQALEREYLGLQEMLAFVLNAVGEKVMVAKATVQQGLPDGTQIQIDDDLAGDQFVFYLIYPEQEAE